ncbi:hypothetical protein [Botrimarina sp.]|uniref:hypothetical protein n=1 Tax=Botrimarina sp. TaxID=2795802 RepID=UPI0032ED4929
MALLACAAAAPAQPPVVAPPAQAEWAPPAGWLVVVEVADLTALTERARLLLKPWDRNLPDVVRLAEQRLGQQALGDGPWLAVLTRADGGHLVPVVFAPVDDFDAFRRGLAAERAGDLAIAKLGQYEIALAERGPWARLTLLDDADRLADGAADPLGPAPEGDLVVRTSQQGRRWLAERLSERRRAAIDSRGRRDPWRWSDGVQGAVDWLAPYGPVVESLGRVRGEVSVAFSLDAAADELVAAVRAPHAEPAEAAEPLPPPAVPANRPILVAQSAGPLPALVIDLILATHQSRPSVIEAAEFPQPYWDDFADAYRQLLEGYRSFRAVLDTPAADGPVAANQRLAFRWSGDADSFGNLLHLLVVRWNLLNEAANASTPHRVGIERLEPAGWRLSVDLVKAFGLDPTPDITALLDRYYGAGGELQMLVTPRGESAYLVTMGQPPEAESANAPEADETTTDGALLTGAFWLDRWLAWSRQVELVDPVTAGPDRPPMAESPPARLRVTAAGGHLDAEFRLPLPTYRAAVAWRRAEP